MTPFLDCLSCFYTAFAHFCFASHSARRTSIAVWIPKKKITEEKRFNNGKRLNNSLEIKKEHPYLTTESSLKSQHKYRVLVT